MDNNNNIITNEQEQKVIKGYKVFNSKWRCKGFQYEVGKTYTLELKDGEKLECCKNGFHFCTELKDCFNYYDLNPCNRVAEIEAIGNIDKEKDGLDTKMCTDKIKIVREVPYEETLNLVNEGKFNSGYDNYGDFNNGDYNYGNHNKGYFNYGTDNYGNHNNGWRNYGSHNIGNFNRGSKNLGRYNINNNNIGNSNTGIFNIGNHNATSFNKCNYSTGSFCTSSPTYYLFNKPSIWTLKDWVESYAYKLLLYLAPTPVKWINSGEMTDEEKKNNPQYIYTKGYLKAVTEKEMKKEWKHNWDNLFKKDRKTIMSIPNFDPDIFEEITGIKVDMSELNDN